jgi:hypothetical protein
MQRFDRAHNRIYRVQCRANSVIDNANDVLDAADQTELGKTGGGKITFAAMIAINVAAATRRQVVAHQKIVIVKMTMNRTRVIANLPSVQSRPI